MNYKFSNDKMKVEIEYRGNVPDEKLFKSVFDSLMYHFSTHIKISGIKEISDIITRKRKEFLHEILQILVDFQNIHGGEIPKEVQDKFIGRTYGWEESE